MRLSTTINKISREKGKQNIFFTNLLIVLRNPIIYFHGKLLKFNLILDAINIDKIICSEYTVYVVSRIALSLCIF